MKFPKHISVLQSQAAVPWKVNMYWVTDQRAEMLLECLHGGPGVMQQIDQIGWDKMCWGRGFTLLHWAAKHALWLQLYWIFMMQSMQRCTCKF